MKTRRLVFRVGSDYYALLLEPVLEIIGRTPAIKEEDGRHYVQVRQDKIPCFELSWPHTSTTSIICKTEKGVGALFVDEVCGIFRKKDYIFHASPLSLSSENLQSFVGVLEIETLKIKAYELNLENFLKLSDPDFTGPNEMQVQRKSLENNNFQKLQTVIEIPFAKNKSAVLSVSCVEKIIRFRMPSPISGLPEFATGLINVEGTIVPLIDLQLRLDGQISNKESARIIVFSVQNTKWGFSVSRISNLRQIPLIENNSDPHPFGALVKSSLDEELLLLEPKVLVNF